MSDEPKLLRVYIDESGDEGIDTGGSRWFILGAVLILEEELDQIEAIVPVIRQRMNKEPSFVLRWRKMDYETRLFVSQQVATVGLGFSCVVIDKEHDRIKTSGLRGKYMMYNYATRYLVERISWFARDLGLIARLTFEHRSNLDYDALWEYLKYLRLFATGSSGVFAASIDWENYGIVPKHKSKALQLADNCCGMVWDGLTTDRYGNPHPEHALNIAGKFYRRSGKLFSYGLKFMPENGMKYIPEFPWLDELRRA